MNIAAVVQARMGSSRLPGKVLKDLGGESVLARVVQRLRRSTLISEVVLATSVAPGDEAVAREAERLGVCCFRGSESDVLDRFYQAARAFHADVIVRITADCPLIDPEVADHTVRAFVKERPDYASNGLERTYPRGLDTEVMSAGALARAWRKAKEPYEREHVTPFFYEHLEVFRIVSVTNDIDYSSHRWTLDTAEDLEFIRAVYTRFDNRDDFSWRDVLGLLEREPDLSELNSQVRQKALREA
ncbi:MAG TPA: glycosyltransferase family protein [Terriglobales bacterium]|nr:glycosyltransferase family protein [Terriglobales bacterium]